MASNYVVNLMEMFNSEVAHLDDDFKANYQTLNSSKSNYVFFHRERKKSQKLPLSLSIVGQEVETVTVVRFLAALIDECLKFSNHVYSVA